MLRIDKEASAELLLRSEPPGSEMSAVMNGKEPGGYNHLTHNHCQR
jgi:hypothetical protein